MLRACTLSPHSASNSRQSSGSDTASTPSAGGKRSVPLPTALCANLECYSRFAHMPMWRGGGGRRNRESRRNRKNRISRIYRFFRIARRRAPSVAASGTLAAPFGSSTIFSRRCYPACGSPYPSACCTVGLCRSGCERLTVQADDCKRTTARLHAPSLRLVLPFFALIGVHSRFHLLAFLASWRFKTARCTVSFCRCGGRGGSVHAHLK